MAEKIKIASLDIDTDALIKSTKDLKKQIDELRASQKELTKEGKTASTEFVQNAADLKVLTGAYNSNIKAIADSTKAKVDEANRTDLLTLAIDGEVTSIKEAREQNKLLNRLRNETNVTTKEGQEQLEQLNAKLDQNNEFIKENADAYLKQKINIGNYTESIREAIFNGESLTASLKTTAQGFLGMARSAMAFIATPIGAVVALLAGAFALVKNALNRSEDATNKLRLAFSNVTGVISKVLSLLEPLGEFLIDGIVMGFEAAADAAETALNLIADGLEFLGFESAAEGMKEFNNEIKEGARLGRELAQAEIDLEKAQRKARLTTLEYQKTAEQFRQIRDDENLSIKERIQANEDLGNVLKEQLKEELAIAETALKVANLRIEAEGKTKENLDAQYEALTEIADIQERITGQESEQLTNRVALQKEAADKAREIADQRINTMEQELELLREQRRFEEDSLQKQQDFANEEIAILKQKLKDKLISETEYKTEKLRIENDLKQFQDETEAKELQSIEEFEAKKKELQDAIRIRNEEDAEAREILKQEQEFAKQVAELENLELTEQQKTDLLALMEEEREIVLAEIRSKYREQEIEAFRNVLQKRNDIEQQAGEAQVAIARSVAQSLIGILGDSLGARLAGIAVDAALQVAQIQSTAAASQAINFAQATATAPPPLNVPFIVQAGIQNAGIATNAQIQTANVIKSAALSGLKTTLSSFGKFEDGGIIGIGGKRHSQGGTKFYGEDGTTFEAERGEGIGILNRGAYASFMDFNNRFGSGKSSGGFFQGGGIITQGVKQETINLDNVVQAIQSMPPAVVAVEEIQTVGRQFINVQNMANL